MSTAFATASNNFVTFSSNEQKFQVNVGVNLPPLETFSASPVDVKNSNEFALFIKPENPYFCHICGLQLEDSGSFNDHYRQCYAFLMSGTTYYNNYHYNGNSYGVTHPICLSEYVCDGPINADTSSNDNNTSENTSGSKRKQASSTPSDDNGGNSNTKKTKVKSKWRCEHCPMVFQYKKDKTEHEYVHTGDKPFACVYCGKKWKNKTALKRHMHTHTGEKPYQCNWCEKRYTQSTLLKTHCEKTHGVLVKFKKGKAVQIGTIDGNGHSSSNDHEDV